MSVTMRMRRDRGARMLKGTVFAALAIPVLLADCATKHFAVAELAPPHIPHDVVGDLIRLNLAYNRDAAMGLSLGPWSRWGFAAIAVLAIVILLRLLSRTAPADRWMAAAIGLVCAGALGNLIDRVRWDRGVVDFIDVGVGNVRFWTFNVADLGVTVGAILLGVLILRRGGHRDHQRIPAP